MTRKSIWVVAAGFLLVVVLSAIADLLMRVFCPNAFSPGGALKSSSGLAGVIVYSAVFGLLGSYLTARLADSRPMLHAMVLGGIAFLINLAGFIGSWHRSPVWYSLGFLAMVLPSAWLGGLLRVRQLRV